MSANAEFIETKPFSIPSKWLRDGLKKVVETPIEQIIGRIQIPEDIDNDCWCWTGATSGGSLGYGHLMFDGEMKYVHRVAYEHFNGPIPSGKYVLHSCDEPTCCNPRHLKIGTQQDNMDDMVTRGRSRRHLRKEEAELVIRLNNEGTSEQEIAALIGVSQYSVRQILTGKRWNKITENGVETELEEHTVG